MLYGAFRFLAMMLSIGVIFAGAFLHAMCPPKTVVVTLIEADREYDRVSLDLAKDFKMADSSAYSLRSEILLHGPPR